MIIKRYIKLAFLFFLLLIVIGLSVIAFDDNDIMHVVKNIDIDYKVLNKNTESCEENNLLYTDDVYNYYCCYDSIYLEWENGGITLLKDSFDSGMVTINSLINHGINITSEMISSED